MKRASQSLSFLLFLLISFSLMSFSSEVVAQTVFITKTGKKYHKESCRYAKSGWAAPLADAKKKGLTACLVCKPSTTDSKTTEPTSIKSNTSETRPTQNTLSQCMATTKAGSRYSRKAASGSRYCWQHAG
ncbi:hypothetical protein GYM62_09285 [Algoriphagus sp. NBT04N3]|jgi:hypothetical protein|uniref:hypothetical protein n=1 Tax=Algoriphagus sp. NBT04N3 TaxID=2705473 RepID=UPI001C635A4B|nr:hypothetical protein [Algoriphagus sp. NBT04N3]QYH37271.1 hypothetical protein GYM62_09285 [Algoriphagus sp. NBT04N3]